MTVSTSCRRPWNQKIAGLDEAKEALDDANTGYQQAYGVARSIGIGESVDPATLSPGDVVAETLTITAAELAELGITDYTEDQVIEQGSTWTPGTIALAELVIDTGATIAADIQFGQAVTDANDQLASANSAVADATTLRDDQVLVVDAAADDQETANIALASAEEAEALAAQAESDAVQAHADAEAALAAAQTDETVTAQAESDAIQAHADAEAALTAALADEAGAAQAEV